MGNIAYYGGRVPALPTSMVQTGAPARSEIVINQASRARALYETVAGGVATGMTPCAPNPAHAALPGHDHSGGVFGVPIVRPYASWVFGYEDVTLGANVTNGRAPQSTITSATGSGEKAFLFRDALKHVWVPGCAPDGAHTKGVFRVVLYASAAVNVYFQYGTNRATYSTALASGRNVVVPTTVCQLNPGAFNRIPFECWLEGTGAGASITVALRSLSLNQTLSTP